MNNENPKTFVLDANPDALEQKQKFFRPSEIVKAFDEGRIDELVSEARKAAVVETQYQDSTFLKKSAVEMARDRIAKEQAARGR